MHTPIVATEPKDNSGNSAWYAAPIPRFLGAPEQQVLGNLVQASQFDVTQAQRDAWLREIAILRASLVAVEGWVALEFDIPRLGSRVDVVVLTGPAIIPIECKVGERVYTRPDFNQAWDYALDLKNFHAASHGAPIFPILLATEAPDGDGGWQPPHPDGVRPPRCSNAGGLHRAIIEARGEAAGPALDGSAWIVAPYRPTPTIIEAAQSLYARNTVEAISRNDAGAKNLTTTSRTVEAVIESAARDLFKAIVFVTGVPGAGKTLVGLNMATRRRRDDDATHAVFLSGNGPLVAVLREALTRDELARRKARGQVTRKGVVAQQVKPFIQNVHHFRDDGVRTLETRDVPHDRVVIFDEAQRAWDLAKTADFMKRRKGRPGFNRSEPQFLIEYMDRHPDWAVIICLVGGGQEINTGEAGISTWLDAVREHFPAWRAYISPQLSDSEYAAGHALEKLNGVAWVERNPELHLSVSMRAFRSEKLSAFIKALLDIDADRAHELLRHVAGRYPIAVTRDLDAAKRWTRRHARGSERYGLVASSEAQRLKPYAVDVRVNVDPVHWFLNDADDTRSSFYLEDAATEYQIQGLELDWICMTWDADLRFDGRKWQHWSFNAKGWQKINKVNRQHYLVNAYRVLLTRARQGMVIFVPPGDSADPTRPPEYYDATYAYLRDVGISPIDA
jgi:hypothetical protein